MGNNESKALKIAWLDVPAPEVERINRAMLPEGFVLERPLSRTDHEEHLRLVSDADFVMHTSIKLPSDMVRAMRQCKLIQKWGVGVDSIAVDTAAECGIPVAITAGANAVPVAELAVTLMLTLYRRILVADRNTRSGVWLNAQLRTQCFTLRGKKVGIVGIGNVGKHLARLLQGFGANVVYTDVRALDADEEAKLGIRFESLTDICETCDIISLHVPMTPKTKHMIGENEIARMKPNMILINTARGGLIDELALAKALEEKRIAGAGLDVQEGGIPTADYHLSKFDNVVLTPHNGGGTLDNVEVVTRHAYGNMLKVLRGEPLDPRDIISPRG